ncbi:hypothetical protein SI65_07163 [Aspergillus cristatus]|uniref:Smr domain-containing protein n=1 Tax=Aspergillus cristatus TaxID=573508 RepID=A0A1E3B9D2_ASPCR|nr:hypothetical protein SI65_07163 [Aspergillus cristatus]
MGEKSDNLFQGLEKTYCPPLDAALFTAIVSDYDLSDSNQVQQARDTLDILQLSALEQEDLPFDPSGTSGLGTTNNDNDGIVSDRSASRNDCSGQSQKTDLTSLTSEFSSIDMRDRDLFGYSNDRSTSSESAGYILGADGNITLAGASEEDKTSYLMEMFPSVDRFTIQHTLKKSDGDVDRAMDVLLNLAFFDEQPPDNDGGKVSIPKGIDGFQAGSSGKGRKRKTKNKKNRNQELSSPVGSEFDESPSINKWDAGLKDVDYIHSRTSPILKKETVTSTYHANGASLPATIRALAIAHAPKDEKKVHENPVMAAQVAELTQEFPSITPITFAGLLCITRNSTSAANELAAALITRPMTPSVSQLIQFTATPPALDLEDETPNRRKPESRVIRDFDRAQGTAGAHFVAGAEAFSKASMAYRRGKSDRLMGGAAAYYSSIGRDHLERAKRNAAAASDALVDSQSTSTMLDLHGVSVQDAVRISSERVQDWWDALGDTKYMRAREGRAYEGYRIVTGVGRHSHDGTSRLGPAVFKRLVRDGWRVEVGEGVFTVLGVSRR